MSTNVLEKTIDNIRNAILLERKSDQLLPEIISAIKQASLKENPSSSSRPNEKPPLSLNLKKVIAEIKEAHLVGNRRMISLPKIISDIKNAYKENWKTDYLPYAEGLAIVLAKGLPTPVLTVCGRGTREIRFTRYLSYFLNPEKKHGLGSALLKEVFKRETKNLPHDWAERSKVYPELWIGNYYSKNGRKYDCICDIGVIGTNFAVIIEQKILSSEDTGSNDKGQRQLQRYDYALSHNPDYKDKQLIKLYLTPTGKTTEKNEDWQPMTHQDIIARSIKLISDQSLSATARENLRRLLVDLATGPYQVTEDTIDELESVIRILSMEDFSLPVFLNYRRLTEKNRLLLNIIKEGS